MAIIVNLKLSNQPEKREQAVNFFNRILPGTRSYDGCHWFYIVQLTLKTKINGNSSVCGIVKKRTMYIFNGV